MTNIVLVFHLHFVFSFRFVSFHWDWFWFLFFSAFLFYFIFLRFVCAFSVIFYVIFTGVFAFIRCVAASAAASHTFYNYGNLFIMLNLCRWQCFWCFCPRSRRRMGLARMKSNKIVIKLKSPQLTNWMGSMALRRSSLFFFLKKKRLRV